MTHSTHLFLQVFLFCAGLLGLLSLGITLVRMKREKKNDNVIEENTKEEKIWTKKNLKYLISNSIFLVIGCLLGYLIRDHQFVTNTRTYYGVTILSQQNDHQYTVHIPDYPRDWPWIFCHPLKMPSTVIDIRYEQRYGCKNVNGVGFVAPSKLKESRDAIQNGHDSTAATTTAGRLAETF